MKRKVIKQGNGTLTITLPKKWTEEMGLKGGEEIDVEEKEGNISVRAKKNLKFDEISVDITNFDRTAIIFYIRYLYRNGFNTIRLRFRNSIAPHLRFQKEVTVLSVISKEVSRLIGMEIIEQKQDSCLLKCVLDETAEEFDKFLRRIFLLISEMNRNLILALKESDKAIFELVHENHDTATRFVSYCVRILNKIGYKDRRKTILLHTLVESLEFIIDIIEDTALKSRIEKKLIKKEVISILENIGQTFKYFESFFYKFKTESLTMISKARADIDRKIQQIIKKTNTYEQEIIDNMRLTALVVIRNMVGVRLGLEH